MHASGVARTGAHAGRLSALREAERSPRCRLHHPSQLKELRVKRRAEELTESDKDTEDAVLGRVVWQVGDEDGVALGVVLRVKD